MFLNHPQNIGYTLLSFCSNFPSTVRPQKPIIEIIPGSRSKTAIHKNKYSHNAISKLKALLLSLKEFRLLCHLFYAIWPTWKWNSNNINSKKPCLFASIHQVNINVWVQFRWHTVNLISDRQCGLARRYTYKTTNRWFDRVFHKYYWTEAKNKRRLRSYRDMKIQIAATFVQLSGKSRIKSIN